LSILPENKLKSKGLRNEVSLMVAFMKVRMAQHFLKADHICVDLAQNLDDPFRRVFSIDADTFVNIVSGDPQRGIIQ